MGKNKCTLLIDGNWLLISRFSVMKKKFDINNSPAELCMATSDLKDMMARSINVMLNKMPMIDNIIFISDGGSWRKQLRIPKQLEDITYKGNREKESTTSWKHVFKALNELSDSCKATGITTCIQSNIEGDDWVWYWSRRLNAEGINCIIWSSDHDLMQLIQNKNDIFTAWYYERSNISDVALHDSFELNEPDPNDLDFFMQPIKYHTSLMEDIIHHADHTIYVDPNTVINEKVICGDSGDNIKSVARIIKNGRKYGVGKKDWEKIATTLHISTIYDLIEKKKQIADSIGHLKKFYGIVSADDILEMIEYNIKLVWLNDEVIPATVIDIMNVSEYNTIDIDYIKGSYRSILNDDDEIINIFES